MFVLLTLVSWLMTYRHFVPNDHLLVFFEAISGVTPWLVPRHGQLLNYFARVLVLSGLQVWPSDSGTPQIVLHLPEGCLLFRKKSASVWLEIAVTWIIDCFLRFWFPFLRTTNDYLCSFRYTFTFFWPSN